jgi:hypothetical protein
MLPKVIGGLIGKPAVQREAVKQYESPENAECNDYDGLSLLCRHLILLDWRCRMLPSVIGGSGERLGLEVMGESLALGAPGPTARR